MKKQTNIEIAFPSEAIDLFALQKNISVTNLIIQ